ncbi:MAG TPA: response regulator [Bryobacteraceae bacterium]
MIFEHAKSPVLLVVDDEPIIRELLDAIFRIEGFTVLTARDGDDAIEKGQIHRGEIALSLLDFSLTLRDSRLIGYLGDRCTMGILLMSGYSKDTILQRLGSGNPNYEFLQKPFTRDMVVERVRDVLSRQSPARPAASALHSTTAGKRRDSARAQ